MNFAEINIIMDQHFCTVQNEIYILYICRECWDILRDASSRWHCLMYLLSANKKPSSTCSANQRLGWGHHCHDLNPVMGWEQEVTRGRSKNVFIAKIVLKDDYYCILSPTPHLFSVTFSWILTPRVLRHSIFSQLGQISIYDLTIWHSLFNWIRNHFTLYTSANITDAQGE